MVRSFSCFAADGDCIYLGNSMPVRYWNSFAQTAIPTENVRANRGANGIDGQISGFLGVSARCSVPSPAPAGSRTYLPFAAATAGSAP